MKKLPKQNFGAGGHESLLDSYGCYSCIVCLWMSHAQIPFLLRDFLECKIYAQDIPWDDFEFPLMYDIMSDCNILLSNDDHDAEHDEKTPLLLLQHCLVRRVTVVPRLSLEKKKREYVPDKFKVKLVENLALGCEIEVSCDENCDLHRKNWDLCNEFIKLTKLVNPFITPSTRVGSSVTMVLESKLENVRRDLRLLQEGKVTLENKLVDNHLLEGYISLLYIKVASLELENIGHVDKIVMLELGVQKLKCDLRVFAVKNTDL
ncbi:unnamed protein product [Lactuca saligna]|uniref:Uncharacterized protein n=1 Tax=Lactuca saligna TaxID=75948 RepID=A0AA36A293_LACSI|nr:unnamed protein product [Lactuca saligna]